MTAWGKMDRSIYDGKCVNCEQPYAVGSPLWFIKGQRGYACSEGCLQVHATTLGIALDASPLPLARNGGGGATSMQPAHPIAVNAKETRPTGFIAPVVDAIMDGIKLSEQVSIYATGYRDGFRDGRRTA